MYRFIALFVAVLAAAVAGQQPTFHSTTDVVSIFATVTDAHHRLVTDLSAEDFEILDEGRQQPLAFFSKAAPPLAIIVILDTSIGTTLKLDQIREAAEQFVVRLRHGDRARICAFNDKIQFSEVFTSDRSALARSVEEIDFGNGTRLYDALAASLDELQAVAGRRVVLLFTGGQDTDSTTRLRTVIDRARAADVMVYAIGLDSRVFDGEDFVDSAPDVRLQRLAIDTGGGYFELEHSRDLISTFRRVSDELHSQYVLAFAPTPADGRRHKLAVRIKNRRLKVRARQSYLAPVRQ